jgi:hypothetical protein
VDIDAVEQWAADLAEVLLDLSGGAAALARGIAVEAAFALVQTTTAPQYDRRVPVGRSPESRGGSIPSPATTLGSLKSA